MNEAKDNPDSKPQERSLDEGVVCTACLEVNPPRIDYCIKCGAPLNTLVAFNPFDQTLVEGFAYRRALDGPPSKIILAGMWVLFSPALFTAFFIIGPLLWSVPTRSDVRQVLFEYAYWEGYFIISVVILYRTTANYFAKRKTKEPETG